jgi:hypothetical protein
VPIVISGHLASANISVAERKPFSPQPATGRHAEVLAEITILANQVLKFVELERTGVCDGQGFWIAYDPIVATIRKLAVLGEQRVSDATTGRAG